ncbi:hypothetical protein [Clostridium sp. BJN0013]
MRKKISAITNEEYIKTI